MEALSVRDTKRASAVNQEDMEQEDTGRLKKKQSLSNIDYRLLELLQEEFVSCWKGEDLGLTREQFKAAMKKTVGHRLSDDELERMYAKVVSDRSGLVSWGNFITSLSSLAILRANMEQKAIKPLLETSMHFIETKFRDEVVAIRFIPRLSLYVTKIHLNSGRYLMLSREGTLTMWTLDLCLLASHFVGNTGIASNTPMYYTDMSVLYPSTMIAVTATDRKITIYDLGSRGIQEKYTIASVGNAITCMDYWSDLQSRTHSLLLWGDTGGDIHALEINVNRLGGIFGEDENREIITRVVYTDLLKNKYPTAVLHKVPSVHDQWVTAVRYIPQNRAFLSSSISNTQQSLCYSDWLGKADTRYFLNLKAVLCFDFNFVIHLVVTGCLDCRIRVWNFFMGSRPFNTLKGHIAPVIHVALNPVTHNVISVDKTHAIKVFNYHDGTVIQAFSGPSLHCMGSSPINGFFFNRARCQLIVATTLIATTNRRVNPPEMAEVSAHESPIAAVCYSSAFEEIITACTEAVISVWDVHTGKHIIEFKHQSSRCTCQDVPWESNASRLEVTAMVLDNSERCVVTGANDGTVNLWNFSSGVLLAHYDMLPETLVTGLAVERNTIYATGWFRQIYMFSMHKKSVRESYKCFQNYHQEDVNCLALVKGGLIASGSYDGDIIVLSRDSGQTMCRLNAGESQTPIPMRTMDDKKVHVLGLDEEEEEESETISEESFMDADAEFEDFSILRCIRIADDKVMIANPADPHRPLRIIHKPKERHKSPLDANMVHEVYNGRSVTKKESDNTFRAFESSVDIIISLDSRKHLDINTANVITAGAEGWIRAWSLNPKGGLRGQFLATEQLGEAVKAMVTDKDNEFLITGDTLGYVKIWDLWPYCNQASKHVSEEYRQQRRDKIIQMFIFMRSAFLRDEAAEGFKRCAKHHKRMPPEESSPDTTLKTPKLLNVFHAHMQDITAMTFVDRHQLIITTSKDCSVRVWTIKGAFVGNCGAQWVRLLPTPRTLRPLPRDIRRNASARTFRVIKGGRMPAWERAVKLINNYLEEQRKEEEKRAKLEAEKAKSGQMEDLAENEEAWLSPVVLVDREEKGVAPEMQLRSVVNFNWKDPKKSKILGMSYKPNLHHRPVSYTPRINMKEDFRQLAAYRQIPISDINHVTDIPTPQIIKDIEKRRREEEEEAKLYRLVPKKQKGPRSAMSRALECVSQTSFVPRMGVTMTSSRENSTQNNTNREAAEAGPGMISGAASRNATQNNQCSEFDQSVGCVTVSMSTGKKKNLKNNTIKDGEFAGVDMRRAAGKGRGCSSVDRCSSHGSANDGAESANALSPRRVSRLQSKRLGSHSVLTPIIEETDGGESSPSSRSSNQAAPDHAPSTHAMKTSRDTNSSAKVTNTKVVAILHRNDDLGMDSGVTAAYGESHHEDIVKNDREDFIFDDLFAQGETEGIMEYYYNTQAKYADTESAVAGLPPIAGFPGSTTKMAKPSPHSSPLDGSRNSQSESGSSGELTPNLLPDILPAKASDAMSPKARKELYRGTGLILKGISNSSVKFPINKRVD